VCPRADLKVYLTASVEERARRRQSQLQEQGVCITLSSLERELVLRDTHDAGRAVAPLRKARDAMEIDTTDLSANVVIERICDEAIRRACGEERAC
jgi:cytidylate kinase